MSTVTEPFGVSAAHTSVPREEGLALDPRGRRHLVVAEAPHPSVTSLLAADATAEAVSAADLTRVLATAQVGVRIYLHGSHGFVRRMAALAADAGATRQEIVTGVLEDSSRRVYCVHCRTVSQTTAAEPTCTGCEARLVVYHHFSRRHAAFMGFSVDAESPAT